MLTSQDEWSTFSPHLTMPALDTRNQVSFSEEKFMHTHWDGRKQTDSHTTVHTRARVGAPAYSFITHCMPEMKGGHEAIAKSKIKFKGKAITPGNFLFMHD